MTTSQESDLIYGRLAAWLATEGLGETGLDQAGQSLNNIGALPFPDLFAGFCTRVNEWICPLWRSTLGLEVLNPELRGSQLVWREGALTRTEVNRAGLTTRTDYLRSAIHVVDTTNRPFRWHLPQPVPDMELIERFHRENGMTDYFRHAAAVPGRDPHLHHELCHHARRRNSPRSSSKDYRWRRGSGRRWRNAGYPRHIALDLLAHYLGRGPAERVYAGQIERGDVTRIEAAILICDLRNFTAMTDNAQHGEIVTLLNRWFEAIGVAIGAHRGDILKFMGDGLLAVFPRWKRGRTATCDRALDAALAALMETDAVNETLAAEKSARRSPSASGCIGARSSSATSAPATGSGSGDRAGGQPRQQAAGPHQGRGRAGAGLRGVCRGDQPAAARAGRAAGARTGDGRAECLRRREAAHGQQSLLRHPKAWPWGPPCACNRLVLLFETRGWQPCHDGRMRKRRSWSRVQRPAAGSVISTWKPRSGRLSKRISPSIASASAREIERPRPMLCLESTISGSAKLTNGRPS